MPKQMATDYVISVCEVYGIDPKNVRRVIIDAEAGEPVRVYFDTYGTDALVRLLPPMAQAADVRSYIRNENGEAKEVTTAA